MGNENEHGKANPKTLRRSNEVKKKKKKRKRNIQAPNEWNATTHSVLNRLIHNILIYRFF